MEDFFVAGRGVGQVFSTFCRTGQVQSVLPPLPRKIVPSCVRCLSIVRSLRQRGGSVQLSSVDSTVGLPHPNIAEAIGRVRTGKCLRGLASPSSKHIACVSVARGKRELSEGCSRSCFDDLTPCLSRVSRRRTSGVVQAVKGFCRVVYSEERRCSG